MYYVTMCVSVLLSILLVYIGVQVCVIDVVMKWGREGTTDENIKYILMYIFS